MVASPAQVPERNGLRPGPRCGGFPCAEICPGANPLVQLDLPVDFQSGLDLPVLSLGTRGPVAQRSHFPPLCWQKPPSEPRNQKKMVQDRWVYTLPLKGRKWLQVHAGPTGRGLGVG